MSYGLGVDLGTISTAAATTRAGRREMVALSEQTVVAPAVVFAHPDGRLLTGDAATRRASQDPHRAAREFKRRLGDPTPVLLGGAPYSPTMLMAAALRDAVGRASALNAGPPERLVLTYPAGWRTYRREQFAGVPALAGVPEAGIGLVAEPVAAAAWYAATQRHRPGDVIAVYDLGGGTFDAAVVRLGPDGEPELLGDAEGVEWLGGVDFDEAVIGHVDRALGGAITALDAGDPHDAAVLTRVRQECVAAKEALSLDDEVTMRITLADRDARVDLSRRDFEALIRPMLTVTVETLGRVIESAGVRPTAVLLVGGSSRIPLVAEVVREAFGLPVVTADRPEQTVALGAARWAERAVPEAVSAALPVPEPPRRRGRRVLTGLLAAVVLCGVGVGAAAYAVGPAGLGPQHFGLLQKSGVPSSQRIGSIGSAPRSVTFAPDGRTAYVASSAPDVLSVVDVAAGRVRDTLILGGAPRGVAVSPDGKRLYVTVPGALSVVDPQTGQEISSVPVGPDPGTPAVTPDGRQVLVPDRREATVTVVDALHDVPISTLETGGASSAVAVTPDGRRAFAADPDDGVLYGIDVPSGSLLTAPVPVGALPSAVAAGNGVVAVADYDSGTVSLVDPARAAVAATVKVGATPVALAFAPDGRTLYVADDTKDIVSVVDTATRRVTATVPVGRGPAAVAVSATGLVYVVNGGDRTLSVLRADG